MGYTITDTKQVERMTPAGSVVTVYQVWIATDKGATGMLETTKDKWNTEDLPVLLQEKERELDLAFTVSGS